MTVDAIRADARGAPARSLPPRRAGRLARAGAHANPLCPAVPLPRLPVPDRDTSPPAVQVAGRDQRADGQQRQPERQVEPALTERWVWMGVGLQDEHARQANRQGGSAIAPTPPPP